MLRSRAVWSYFLVVVAACAANDGDPVSESVLPTARVAASSQDVRVVFSTSDKATDLQPILAGNEPRTFHWVLVTVASGFAERVYSQSGYLADLTDSNSGVSFAQVYRDVCDPAKEDYTPCWIFERYRAGDPNVSGRLHVQLTEVTASSAWDIVFEGLTDRFGGNIQMHKHQSLAGAIAPIEGGGQ